MGTASVPWRYVTANNWLNPMSELPREDANGEAKTRAVIVAQPLSRKNSTRCPGVDTAAVNQLPRLWQVLVSARRPRSLFLLQLLRYFRLECP